MCKEIRPDLVLLDLNIAHIDNFRSWNNSGKMKKVSYTPILVLTTQSDRNIRFNALAAEARDFVEKPFDITEVVP